MHEDQKAWAALTSRLVAAEDKLQIRLSFHLRVKDSAGPCDCIKDLDGSQPIKKTQIDSTLSANLNSLCVLECVDTSKCK